MQSLPLNKDPAKDDAIKRIDQEIETHSAAILALNFRRNQLAPISSLPPEILCKIFFYAKIAEPRYSYIGERYGKGPPWVKVSHVNTHWRQVAINSPSLWDDPPLENPSWLAEMLKRSRMADLTINASIESRTLSKMTALVEVLEHHSSRVKHLAITDSASYHSRKIMQELSKFFPLFAPRLETLCIRFGDHYAQGREPLFPSDILSTATNLHRLELTNCAIPWRSCFLGNIRHLKLHSIAVHARPTLTQFVGALKAMAYLESLDIKDTLPPSRQTEGGELASSPVYLSHLQQLVISSTTTEVEALIPWITFSPAGVLAQIAVNGGDYHSDDKEFSTVLSSISRIYLSQEAGLQFQTLNIDEDTLCLDLKLFVDVVETDLRRSISPQTPHLHLRFMLGAQGYRRVNGDKVLLNLFKSGFPLNEVTHVQLQTWLTEPKTLAHTVGVLPALSFVRADENSSKSFINALYPHKIQADNNTAPIYFVNLVSICLQAIFQPQDKHAKSPPHAVDMAQLQECLMQRREYGLEIEELSLNECYNLFEDDVCELEEVVDDVYWDGMEEVHEEESEEEKETSPENSDLDNDYSGYW